MSRTKVDQVVKSMSKISVGLGPVPTLDRLIKKFAIIVPNKKHSEPIRTHIPNLRLSISVT